MDFNRKNKEQKKKVIPWVKVCFRDSEVEGNDLGNWNQLCGIYILGSSDKFRGRNFCKEGIVVMPQIS